MNTYFTPNSNYKRFSDEADRQIKILGDNAKYSLYRVDQQVVYNTTITPSIPSMPVPIQDLRTNNTIYKTETFTSIDGFNTISPDTDATSDKQKLIDNHNEILQLRARLDKELQELYTLNNSLTVENKIAYDTNIYTGLVWTILATSVLYFTFVKL
jgi:hypothetical protein